MKIIPKFLSGSSFATYVPYASSIPYVSIGASSEQAATTTSNSSSSGDITEKDLANMIKEIDALPSDLGVVLDNIKQMYSISQHAPLGIKNSSNSLFNVYTDALYRVKTADYNYKEYLNAYKVVNDNKGLSELAITDTGALVAYNKDTKQLELISVNDYLSNPLNYSGGEDSLYEALTNSNLLYMRAHLPQYAFDNSVFSIVQNGIGLEKVLQLVKQQLSLLGSSSYSSTFGVYLKDGQVIKGAEVLAQLMQMGLPSGTTIDGLYEGKIITKSLQELAKSALDYIYSTLPLNARTLLKIRSGNSENPEQGAYELLGKLVFSTTSDSKEFDLTYKGDTSTKSSSKSSGDDSDFSKIKYGRASQLLLGHGYSSVYNINIGGSTTLQVYSNEMPVTKNNNPIGQSLFSDIVNSDLGPALDFTNATMGGAQVMQSAFDKVFIKNGTAHSLDMPIDMEAYAQGVVRPDLKRLKLIEEADSEIKNSGVDDKDFDRINEIYAKHNLPPKFVNGKYNTGAYAKFVAFDSIAVDKAIMDADLDFADRVKQLDDNEEKQAIDKFDRLYDGKFGYDRDAWWKPSLIFNIDHMSNIDFYMLVRHI